jgi:cathepsin B
MPACIHPIRDQGSCGSCWAFATSEVASDRFCIQSEGAVDEIFSAQFLVDCDTGASACNGANTQSVITWMDKYGIVTDKCYPYFSGETKKGGKCHKTTCTETEGNTEEFHKFEFNGHHNWNYAASSTIQKEIMAGGPVFFSMNVYKDFRDYEGGIYVKAAGADKLGGHAVKAIGWGTIPDTEGLKDSQRHYWIVANSWGVRFGESGFFNIRFDQDIAYKAGALTAKLATSEVSEKSY